MKDNSRYERMELLKRYLEKKGNSESLHEMKIPEPFNI